MPGIGLLGDAPVVPPLPVGGAPPLNPNIAALAAAAATRAMFQQQQQQKTPLKTVTPTATKIQHPKQNRAMLIQQFRKLREAKVSRLLT